MTSLESTSGVTNVSIRPFRQPMDFSCEYFLNSISPLVAQSRSISYPIPPWSASDREWDRCESRVQWKQLFTKNVFSPTKRIERIGTSSNKWSFLTRYLNEQIIPSSSFLEQFLWLIREVHLYGYSWWFWALGWALANRHQAYFGELLRSLLVQRWCYWE